MHFGRANTKLNKVNHTQKSAAITFKHDCSVMYAELLMVLIVGTSVGYLDILLYKTNIPFEIYERTPEIKTLGAAMYFNATVANQFKQRGINDGVVLFSKFISVTNVCNEQRESGYKIDFEGHNEVDGSKADGDIPASAGEAHSDVRWNLSAKLLKNRRPSPSDAFPLPFSTVYLVGQTRSLTPDEFPDIALVERQFRKIARDF